MPAAFASTIDNADAIGTASPYWYDIAGNLTIHHEAGAGSASVITGLNTHDIQLVPMVTEDAGLRAFARILENLDAPGHPRPQAGGDRRTQGVCRDRPGLRELRLRPEAPDGARRHASLRSTRSWSLRCAARCTRSAAAARSRSWPAPARLPSMPTRTSRHGSMTTKRWPLPLTVFRSWPTTTTRPAARPVRSLRCPGSRQVIAFARTQADPRRYELGVPAYGYEWYGRTSATAVFARQASALAAQVHAQPRWDADAGEETFSYREHHHRHTVWYENSAADSERARLAAAADFSGVAVWAAGYEQPQLWRGLDQSWPR